ncbi:MAG TPA: hypothetical protein VNM67_25325 [Thermoanaerobaculia bacterium]|nr:hypothetical protein [Thermoanaerobaculia bacterium]
MVTELPPPPAALIERLEASFPLPAALSPYEHLWAGEGETPPASVPVRQYRSEVPENPVFGVYASANPIELVLDRLGSLLQMIWDRNVIRMPVTESSHGGGGLGDGSPDPVPTGDPIPVDGGGRPGG